MVKRVLFVRQRRAEAMPGRASCALISITDPEGPQARLRPGWHAVLRVAFHDVDPISFPAANPDLQPLTRSGAACIADFALALSSSRCSVVVHCRSGISRSAGVAKAIAEHAGLRFPSEYREFNQHVYRVVLEELVLRAREPNTAFQPTAASVACGSLGPSALGGG